MFELLLCDFGWLVSCPDAPLGSAIQSIYSEGGYMAVDDIQRNDAYRFFSIAFGAAPGATYYDQLLNAYDAGMTTRSVVNVFTTKSQFTNIYATSLTHKEFANLIIENVVGDSATTAAKTEAKLDVEQALNANWTRGDIVYQLFSNLAAKSADDAKWAGTAKLMSNRVEVAKFVSEYRPMVTTDLTLLQNVIKNVTKDTDVSSVDALKTVVTTAGVNLGGLKPQTSSADTYKGTDGNDAVDGGSGNDTLDGGLGNDILIGGSGADKLYGGYGQDYIEGGDGADEIELGYFLDTKYISGYFDAAGRYISGYNVYTPDAWFEVADGGDGSDSIMGGVGSDLIYGGEGADTLYGDDGYWSESYYLSKLSSAQLARMHKDTIHGGEGDDVIYAGPGLDVVTGDGGADRIYTGRGDDTADGGDGNDTIDSDYGSDTMRGGAGDDLLDLSYPSAGVTALIDGGAGNDRIYFSVDSVDNAKVAVVGGEGADTFSMTSGGDALISIDLTESVQSVDKIEVYWNAYDNDKPLNPVVVHGFSLANDAIDIGGFNAWGNAATYSVASAAQTLSYSGVLSRNYVQVVDSAAAPWALPEAAGVGAGGKGVFVIRGAQAAAADVDTVAAFLDAYGNNAAYAKSATHYFVFDIQSVGLGVYRFMDDTGANARIVGDELVPLVVLAGVTTAQLDATQPGYFLI